jgi:hypothetical protein
MIFVQFSVISRTLSTLFLLILCNISITPIHLLSSPLISHSAVYNCHPNVLNIFFHNIMASVTPSETPTVYYQCRVLAVITECCMSPHQSLQHHSQTFATSSCLNISKVLLELQVLTWQWFSSTVTCYCMLHAACCCYFSMKLPFCIQNRSKRPRFPWLPDIYSEYSGVIIYSHMFWRINVPSDNEVLN